MLANTQEALKTREQMKDDRKKNKEDKMLAKRGVRVRLIPIWLRVLLILITMTVCLALGAVFGYSVIGNGQVSDTFNKETWMHIVQLINKE